MKDPLVNWRNTLYADISNWLASWLPTREYVAYLRGSIEYGMRSATRDAEEGREPPPDWRE